MMRHGMRPMAVALALVMGGMALLSGQAAALGLAQRNVDPRESTCVVDLEQSAWPSVLLAGETTELRLRVRATCPGSRPPLHVVLVLDASGSMAGEPTQRMKDAARSFVQILDLPSNPDTKVAVVGFNSTARTLCQMTNEAGRVRSCIGKIGANGGSAIDRGITEGIKVLRQGRNQARGELIHEIMIVLSDGENNEGCESVKQAARQAKGMGVLLITICLGSACDAACMREVASSARFFYQVQSASGLIQVFERIHDEVIGISLRLLEVVDTLPDNMAYVADSSEPPADVSADGKQLEWPFVFLPREGVTITYRVRPLEAGFHPVKTSTVVAYRDNQNRYGRVDTVGPWVHVFGAAVRPRP